jgi:hypothetical protein
MEFPGSFLFHHGTIGRNGILQIAGADRAHPVKKMGIEQRLTTPAQIDRRNMQGDTFVQQPVKQCRGHDARQFLVPVAAHGTFAVAVAIRFDHHLLQAFLSGSIDEACPAEYNYSVPGRIHERFPAE